MVEENKKMKLEIDLNKYNNKYGDHKVSKNKAFDKLLHLAFEITPNNAIKDERTRFYRRVWKRNHDKKISNIKSVQTEQEYQQGWDLLDVPIEIQQPYILEQQQQQQVHYEGNYPVEEDYSYYSYEQQQQQQQQYEYFFGQECYQRLIYY